MADVSNPTTRVLEVLKLLAAHPTEAFTLVEIARQLGLSISTTHRILTTMTDAQFLSRHPAHKTFSLGVVPVAIGEAALSKHRGLEFARREITRLAVELNVQCTINAIVDDELLLLAKEGTPRNHSGLQRVGERTPVLPPVGIGIVAWSNEQVVAHYLEQAKVRLSDAMQDYLRAALPLIRARGYSVAAVGPAMRRLRQTMILPIGQPRDEAYWESLYKLVSEITAEELQLFDFGEKGGAEISYISAPVFSPKGTVAFELVITGTLSNLGPLEVQGYGEKLRASADIITAEAHGRVPGIRHAN